jgi:YesN/AraC family two-component response regulator
MKPKILLVDDDELVLTALRAVLIISNFRVTTATNVTEALHLIDTETFDVLLSDLHMPGAGDGLTVVSAMYHTHPDAVTLILSGFPELQAAANAILSQPDEVLTKPITATALVSVICTKLQNRQKREPPTAQRISCILERRSSAIIFHWLTQVQQDPELMSRPLRTDQRTKHLPALIENLVQRLQTPRNSFTRTQSIAAIEHGIDRYRQGYTVPMMVEESRLFHLTLFQTLQNNMSNIDFSLLVTDLRILADEVDLQLKSTMIGFSESSQRTVT